MKENLNCPNCGAPKLIGGKSCIYCRMAFKSSAELFLEQNPKCKKDILNILNEKILSTTEIKNQIDPLSLFSIQKVASLLHILEKEGYILRIKGSEKILWSIK